MIFFFFVFQLPPLANGDLVKIDLGAHIDGYIAVGAHTLVVGGLTEDMKTGLRADVMVAAWRAADVASRLIKNGNTNAMVTEAIKRIAEAYNVRAISGTVMHEMKRWGSQFSCMTCILANCIFL